MRVSAFAPLAAALAVAVAVAVVPAASADAPRINGWFPCHDSMAAQGPTTNSTGPLFECAEVEVPLCYEGICKSPKAINIFVKRMPASKPTKPRKALWFLQGGPGMSSATSTRNCFDSLSACAYCGDFSVDSHVCGCCAHVVPQWKLR